MNQEISNDVRPVFTEDCFLPDWVLKKLESALNWREKFKIIRGILDSQIVKIYSFNSDYFFSLIKEKRERPNGKIRIKKN